MTDNVGPIIDGGEVEDAVVATLAKWMSYYLRVLETRKGLTANSLPNVRSITVFNEFDHWPEHQLPGLVVVAPGLYDEPRKTGAGIYRARWAVAVAAITSASTPQATKNLAKVYAAAARLSIMQHSSLEPAGFALGAEWLHEAYDDLDVDDTQVLGVGKGIFWVEVDNVMNIRTRPPEPTDEVEDLPVVLTTNVTVNQEALT